MANGRTPVPHMPTGVLSFIQSETFDGGGWGTPTRYLYMVQDGDGSIEWDLDVNAPDGVDSSTMSTGDDALIQECTLDANGYDLVDGEVTYKLHANTGPGTAVMAQVE